MSSNFRKESEADVQFKEDMQKLGQIVKEAKEVPYYKNDLFRLYQDLMGLFIYDDMALLFKICEDDDGKIDKEEADLLEWYLYDYHHRMERDYNYVNSLVNQMILMFASS